MIFWFNYKSPRIGCHYDYSKAKSIFGELELFFELSNHEIYNYYYCPFYAKDLHILDKIKIKEKDIGKRTLRISNFEFLLKKKISYTVTNNGALV